MRKLFGPFYYHEGPLEKCVIVPQEDIDKIEEARMELWRILEDKTTFECAAYSFISGPMWNLTHRKYPKIF